MQTVTKRVGVAILTHQTLAGENDSKRHLEERFKQYAKYIWKRMKQKERLLYRLGLK